MRILICGDRFWTDGAFLADLVATLVAECGPFHLIEGEAHGVDRLARDAAVAQGLSYTAYPAQWDAMEEQGIPRLAAGPIRNTQMLREGTPDLVVAVHDMLAEGDNRAVGRSSGTRNMVNQALARRVWTRLYNHVVGPEEPVMEWHRPLLFTPAALPAPSAPEGRDP